MLEAGEIISDMDAKFAMLTKKLSDYYEVQIVYSGLRSSLYFFKKSTKPKNTIISRKYKKKIGSSKKEED